MDGDAELLSPAGKGSETMLDFVYRASGLGGVFLLGAIAGLVLLALLALLA